MYEWGSGRTWLWCGDCREWLELIRKYGPDEDAACPVCGELLAEKEKERRRS